VRVTQINRGTAAIGFSQKHAKEIVPITFILSNGQKLEWDLEGMISEADSLKTRRLFGVSVFVFFAGVIIQVIGFIIEIIDRKKNRQPLVTTREQLSESNSTAEQDLVPE
jgi:hypothetical protein